MRPNKCYHTDVVSTKLKCGYEHVEGKDLGIYAESDCVDSINLQALKNVFGFSILSIYESQLNDAHIAGWKNNEIALSASDLLDSSDDTEAYNNLQKWLDLNTAGKFHSFIINEPTGNDESKHNERWERRKGMILKMLNDYNKLHPGNEIKVYYTVNNWLYYGDDCKNPDPKLRLEYDKLSRDPSTAGFLEDVYWPDWCSKKLINDLKGYNLETGSWISTKEKSSLNYTWHFDLPVNHIWVYGGDLCSELIEDIDKAFKLRDGSGNPIIDKFDKEGKELTLATIFSSKDYRPPNITLNNYFNSGAKLVFDEKAYNKYKYEITSEITSLINQALRAKDKDYTIIKDFLLACLKQGSNSDLPCHCTGPKEKFCSLYCKRLLEFYERAVDAGWLKRYCDEQITETTYFCTRTACRCPPWVGAEEAEEFGWQSIGSTTRIIHRYPDVEKGDYFNVRDVCDNWFKKGITSSPPIGMMVFKKYDLFEEPLLIESTKFINNLINN